jgi:hypothetical protein
MGVRDLMDVTKLGQSRRASRPFGLVGALGFALRRRRHRPPGANVPGRESLRVGRVGA